MEDYFIDTIGPEMKQPKKMGNGNYNPSSRLGAIYNAIATHLPKIDTKDYSELLWSSTAYPMGDTQYLVDQIIELAAKTDGSLEQCRAYADMETTKAMANRVES